MDNVVVIFGPTASGKTNLAIEIAKHINGEIISADSMQVYKYMNIGTAKPDEQERSGIKHYLIDEIEPNDEFSVARFKEMAKKYINEILKDGKTPIIAGGTGLYINSLIYEIDFSEITSDWEYRNKLQKDAEERGNEHVHNLLKQVDSIAAQRLHINDIKRVIRALEVYKTSGQTITEHQRISRLKEPEYNYIKIGLNMDREYLYKRINDRVELMFKKGLIQEVNNIIALGYGNCKISMQGLGYKEIINYLRGNLSYEEAVDLIKKDTRHLAKRQICWFKRYEDVLWIDIKENGHPEEILKKIKEYLERFGFIM